MNCIVSGSLGITVLFTSAICAQVEPDDPPVSVTTAEVQAGDFVLGVPAAGTVFSRNAAQITAGLDARLEWVAGPGETLAAGEPVARFDCAMLRLRREEQGLITDRERVRFEALGKEADRLEAARLATSLLQIERVRSDRELALREIRISQARLRQIENDLGRCVIDAPITGTVTAQMHQGGEDVSRGDVLATMTDTRHLEVRAAVPIRHLPRIDDGVDVDVRSNHSRFTGRLRTAVPAADATSQTFEVRVDLPDQAWRNVAAGQLVSLNLPLAPSEALTVPRDAIVLRADGSYVMRIAAGQRTQVVAVEVAFEAARASGNRVAVTGDLRAGDQVAVRGAEGLDEGAVVTILSGS